MYGMMQLIHDVERLYMYGMMQLIHDVESRFMKYKISLSTVVTQFSTN